MSRQSESEKAAIILTAIRDAKVHVGGVKQRDVQEALELAISLLQRRAIDAQEDSGE